MLVIKRKKGCDDEKQGDSQYAPASFVVETDRRLSKVEVISENNTLKLQNMSLDQALDRKDIVQTQKDIETMSIKLDGHFSQSREVMVNLTNRFEENTKSMEDHKRFMQNVLDLMKEKNSNGK